MKNPHKKYTYEYEFTRLKSCFSVTEQIDDAKFIAILRHPIYPNSDGNKVSQCLMYIPLSDVQVQLHAPAKQQQPRTGAELVASLRHLSEEMKHLSEAMRYFAEDNHDITEWCRQLSSLSALPKSWAEKIEEGNAK